MIHPTAVIDPKAQIADDVSVGPYSVIAADVKIGKGTRIESHVVIGGPTHIGCDNHIYPYSSIGQAPQDKKYRGEQSKLIIGDSNIIREFTTLHRGTEADNMQTLIGDHNLLMAYAHVAHDCIVGSHTVLANNASLAGHAIVEDYATLGGFSGVHQFCRVGRHAFTGAYTAVIRKDLAPYMLYAGNPIKSYGPNSTGLERAGFSTDTIAALKQAWKDLMRDTGKYKENKEKYAEIAKQHPEIAYLIQFIDNSERGVSR